MEDSPRRQKGQKHDQPSGVEYFNVLSRGQRPEIHKFEHHAELARKRGDKEIQVADANVKSEYKKRLKATRELRRKLQHQMEAVQAEEGASRSSRDSLVAMLSRLQRPMHLTHQWMQVRSKQGAFGDAIEGSLKQSVYEAKESVASLSDLLGDIQKVLVELSAACADLQREIDAKDMTILLDKASMDDALSSAVSLATLQNSVVQRALMQCHGLHTEDEWQRSTSATISSSVAVIEKAKSTRKGIAAALHQIEAAGRTERPLCVVDALQTRMKQTTAHCSSLEVNVKMLDGEIGTLDKQRVMLTASLEKVRQQLENARHRLAVRVVKPPAEVVKAGVEETLEIEVIRMKSTESALMKQLKDLEAKRHRLTHLVAEIKTELVEKGAQMQLDKQCVSMQLPAIESPRRNTSVAVPNGAGSARSSGSGSPRVAKPSLPAVAPKDLIPQPPRPVLATGTSPR